MNDKVEIQIPEYFQERLELSGIKNVNKERFFQEVVDKTLNKYLKQDSTLQDIFEFFDERSARIVAAIK